MAASPISSAAARASWRASTSAPARRREQLHHHSGPEWAQLLRRCRLVPGPPDRPGNPTFVPGPCNYQQNPAGVVFGLSFTTRPLSVASALTLNRGTLDRADGPLGQPPMGPPSPF